MKILGLCMFSIVFLSIIILLTYYIVLLALKKFNSADRLVKILFFHLLFSFMMQTWSIIVMNGSFAVSYSGALSVNVLGIMAILTMLLFGSFDYYCFYHIKSKFKNNFDKIMRRMLTIAEILLLVANNYLFYLGVYHFYILQIIG